MTEANADPNADPPADKPPAPPPPPDTAAIEKERDDANAATKAAVDALIVTTRAAYPTLPQELITGTTPEEVASSVATAQRVRDQVLEANKTPAPLGGNAGAPPRAPDTAAPEGTRGADRIRFGLDKLKE